MASNDTERASNFIEGRVQADLDAGTYGGRVATRFPPEPNGYLHIGHAKSICLNFGLAEQFGGTCNLRYDDTNPSKEDVEFVDSILADVRWLGFEPTAIFHASDYFEQLYTWAEQLVHEGKAYVDESSLEQMRAMRGTVNEPGTPSEGRDRPPADNLRLLREMRDGRHADGSMVLRARIDLAHPNMKMRDPLMYRIRTQRHHRTGDAWCIYPMYDWAHGQSDAIERITHSICTLEFENNRELYDWFLDAIGAEAIGTAELPHQHEFARLQLSYVVLSKRKLLELVKDRHVEGWDDPRMPTIAGFRRRGYTPEAIRAFCDRIGVAKANSVVDYGLLEFSIRDDLNAKAPRRMAVLDPLPVELTNWDAADAAWLAAPDFPPDVGLPGSREVPLTRHLFIERSDFAVEPPKGFKRLVPGGEVRLRHAHVMRCDEVLTDDAGRVTGLQCSLDLDTLGVNPTGRKVKGTIHWVSATEGVRVQARLYDRLFSVAEPGGATGSILDDLNTDSLTVVEAVAEPAVGNLLAGARVQLERQGYFYVDPKVSRPGAVVLNRTVALKDSWTHKPEAATPARSADPVLEGEAAAAHNEAVRAGQEAAFLDAHPDQADDFRVLADAGASRDELRQVLADPVLRALLQEALATGGTASTKGLVTWTSNVVAAALKDADDSKLDGAGLAQVVALVEGDTISSTAGKTVLTELVHNGGTAKAIVEARGLMQMSDDEAVGALVDEVLSGLTEEVARFRNGEQRLFGFFVGQVMKASRGRANPGSVQTALRKKLG